MFDVCCVSFVLRCLLIVACCLFAVSCLVFCFGGCYLLGADCSLSFVVRWLLFWCLLRGGCWWLFVVPCLLYVVRLLLRAVCC